MTQLEWLSPSRVPAWARAAAAGGIIGPATFIAAWSTLGATRAGYSPVANHISDLAAVGTSTRPWMTAGLVIYGVGFPLYGAAAARADRRTIGLLATVSGLATLGVAAFPLGAQVDHQHGVAATVGYITLAAIPLVGAVHLARARRPGWAALSAAMGVAAAASLAGSAAGPHTGLWQRAGLTVADVWVIAHAARLTRGTVRGEPID